MKFAWKLESLVGLHVVVIAYGGWGHGSFSAKMYLLINELKKQKKPSPLPKVIEFLEFLEFAVAA
jgi:hypothetical protein